MKILVFFLIAVLLPLSALAQSEPQRLPAKDACGDDYWRWCAPSEAPYDCFKRRGFFKKDSILSPDCKRAWSKLKSRNEAPAPEADVAPAPKTLNAHSKRPASVPAEAPPQEESPKRSAPKATEEVDDFSNLDFE